MLSDLNDVRPTPEGLVKFPIVNAAVLLRNSSSEAEPVSPLVSTTYVLNMAIRRGQVCPEGPCL